MFQPLKGDFYPYWLGRDIATVLAVSTITFICKQSGLNDPVTIKWSAGTFSIFTSLTKSEKD